MTDLLPVHDLHTTLDERSASFVLLLLEADNAAGFEQDRMVASRTDAALDAGRDRLVRDGLARITETGLDVDPRLVFLLSVAVAPTAVLEVEGPDGPSTFSTAADQVTEVRRAAPDSYLVRGIVGRDRVAERLDSLFSSAHPIPTSDAADAAAVVEVSADDLREAAGDITALATVLSGVAVHAPIDGAATIAASVRTQGRSVPTASLVGFAQAGLLVEGDGGNRVRVRPWTERGLRDAIGVLAVTLTA